MWPPAHKSTHTHAIPATAHTPLATTDPAHAADPVHATYATTNPAPTHTHTQTWPAARRVLAGVAGLLLVVAATLAAADIGGLLSFLSGGDMALQAASDPAVAWRYTGVTLAFVLGLSGLMLAPPARSGPMTPAPAPAIRRRGRPRRTLAAAGMLLLAVPLTIYAGHALFGDRKYYFISLLIILETMLPFALVFERRRPQARELVVMAALCGLAVAGRLAFFMLPQCKPVVALVILSGVAFGGEAGFLVGALTGFVSNLFFAQGPWTPWQMFALGLIGFLAGVLFRKGRPRRNRASLALYGGLAAFFLYGGIMNTEMVLMYQSQPTGAMFLATYLQGIPFDLIHAAATVVFLLILSETMLDKLDRIKVKYGLIE